MTAVLDFLTAAAVAALAGMGIGGGGLLVIWLVLVRSFPAQTAQGINLLFFVLSAACALPLHRRKRTLPTRMILFLVAAAIPGVCIGCHLAEKLSQEAARQCFGYFLLLSGGMQLFRLIRRHRRKR